MSKFSTFDASLHFLNRIPVVWEAIRLNPDYRRDWINNQKYIDWLNSDTPKDRKTFDIVTAWIRKISFHKWGLDRLANPNIRFSPKFSFKGCRKNCISFNTKTSRQELNCQEGNACCLQYLHEIYSLPVSVSNSFVYENNPYELIKPLSKAVLRFLNSQNERLLLWINRNTPRRILIEHLLNYAESANQGNPVRPTKRNRIIRLKRCGSMAVFSISKNLSGNFLVGAIRKAVSTYIPKSNFKTMRDAWKSLEVYEMNKYRGWSVSQIIKRKHGVKHHLKDRKAMKKWKKTPMRKVYERRLKTAQRIIKDKGESFFMSVPRLNWRKVTPYLPPKI